MTEVAAAAQEGLLAMSAAVGLRVMGELLQAGLAAKVGPKGKHDPDRTARSGSTVAASEHALRMLWRGDICG
jgi:hypothetical protein